jgi:hypothetical protein
MTRTFLVKRKPGRLVLLAILAFALIPVASASAGRMLVTGHDSDLHCSGGQQCHFLKTATDWVRAGAPDPTKPVLVLDADDLDFQVSLGNVNTMFSENIPNVVMDPKSPQFAAEPLTVDRYSAILVASDTSCGGCDLNINNTDDSDAINARTADIQAFFNAGGGVFANAGAEHADGDPTDGPDVFYNFLPICPDAGLHNGTNNDINCCATHNSFAEPAAGSPLQVSERDAENNPETLFGEGRIGNGVLDNAAPASAATVPACSSDGKVTVTVTDPAGGAGAKAAHFTVDGGPEQVAPTDSAGHSVITVANGSHTLVEELQAEVQRHDRDERQARHDQARRQEDQDHGQEQLHASRQREEAEGRPSPVDDHGGQRQWRLEDVPQDVLRVQGAGPEAQGCAALHRLI